MHKARGFFFVCAGLLCLALAYHLGARGAVAQAGSSVSGLAMAGSGTLCVMTPNGDCYSRSYPGSGFTFMGDPTYLGNFWSGATPAQGISIGQLKAKYATPAPGKVTR